VITLVTALGDGEVTVVTDETMGEKDPRLAQLLAAATAGAPPRRRLPSASGRKSGRLTTGKCLDWLHGFWSDLAMKVTSIGARIFEVARWLWSRFAPLSARFEILEVAVDLDQTAVGRAARHRTRASGYL
jgi:hypothetical protein